MRDLPLMSDYERIARVIRYLDGNFADQPDLAALALRAGLSESHFHHVFTDWAGATPKEFLQCLTVNHARRLLLEGESVLSAAYGSGLSGPGRLHDLCVSLEAASPGEIKSGGEGWKVAAGYASTPFGMALIAQSPRGVCWLSFPDEGAGAWEEMTAQWPRAEWLRADESARQMADRIFQPTASRVPIRAHVRGSDFQVKVWRALLRIPAGALVSYGAVAGAAGFASASRAVGTAVGQNSISFLIPCHRVIRQTGVMGNYRWDPVRKRAMIAWEGCLSAHASAWESQESSVRACARASASRAASLPPPRA